jgi:hypothetical protein
MNPYYAERTQKFQKVEQKQSTKKQIHFNKQIKWKINTNSERKRHTKNGKIQKGEQHRV